MNATVAERDKQIHDAEELLFSGKEKHGVAKGLFLGRFMEDWVAPYPTLPDTERAASEDVLARLRGFLDANLDAASIDRNADIPTHVVRGLAELGIFGMTAPVDVGGSGMSQMAYCRVMEEIGSRCASTSIFVNVQHSIGMRALLLFGTPEQKQRWLPPLVRGEQFAAFALTEPEAGSDAANVQASAELSTDGSHYILNGEKRYITSGGIAHVLTVMARTADGITAFLVTPDTPGFRVIVPRMEKLGIRGTATAKLAFQDMPVPRENILGAPGKGLRVALSVLDFGRVTFGACCTGAAKTALHLASHHARSRRQFGHPLGDFELIKKKLARMAAYTFAMGAMTHVTASLIDRGLEDYMLETAMLKVFTTEALWTIVNDAFQIHGGAAYFTDLPLERMLRDARINQIGEGANEVLTTFIALVGMRGPGMQLKEVWDALHHPWGHVRKAWTAGLDRAGAALHSPTVTVRSDALKLHATRLGRMIWRFHLCVERLLFRYREAILDHQYIQERIANVAIELYATACSLSRWDADLQAGIMHRDRAAALFVRESMRRTRRWLSELNDNDDEATTAAADAILRHEGTL